MGCRNISLLALAILSIFVISLAATPALAADPITDFLNWLFGIDSQGPTGAQTSQTKCTTAADCYKAGAKYCTCNSAEKNYCLDGETSKVNYYHCSSNVNTADPTGKYCVLSSSSGSSQYICDNGNSVWNNANEVSCSDGKDDDYDGVTDCSDYGDCSGAANCVVPTTSLPSCYQGSAIPSSGCVCGGYNYYSGYCCTNAYSSSACVTATTATTTPTATTTAGTCGEGAIPAAGCSCGGTNYYGGYCCSNVYQASTVCSTLPSCTQGSSIPSSGCVCGGTTNYYSGYCCGTGVGYYSSTACTTTTTYSGTTTTTLPSTSTPCTIGSSIASLCNCGGYSYNNGYCCSSASGSGSGFWQSNTCGTTATTYSGTSTTYPSGCPSSILSILGSGCHYMYTGSDGKYIYCDTDMKRSMKDGDAAAREGCRSETTTTTYSNVCTSSSPWNCYDETACKGAAANWCKYQSGTGGYCSSSVCSTYTCSKTESWYCKDETSCKTAGASWCLSSGGGSGWCSSSSCPTCIKESPWNCYSKDTCSGAGANWCQTSGSTSGLTYSGYCQTSSCPTCSASTQWNCYDETSCKGVAGSWCKSGSGSAYCQSSSCPTCASTTKWNCYDETACKGAAGSWCSYQTTVAGTATGTAAYTPSGYCSDSCPTYTCSKSEPWNCKDESVCKTAGGNWCSSTGGYGYCSNSCPTCDKTNPWNCYTKDACSGIGANWCTSSGGYGNCQTSTCPTCSSTTKYNCYNDVDCKGTGGNWCTSQYTTYSSSTATGGAAASVAPISGWCSDTSCPTYTCSKSEPWNCKDEAGCKGAGASWCGNYCQTGSCPTCSKSQPWYCSTKETCSATGANWCTSTLPIAYASTAVASSPLPISGWCQESSCPTYTCSKTESWYCYDQTSCVGAGAQWCAGYRGSSGYCSQTCPTYECTKESPWNCDTKEKCATISQSWCTASTGSWCASYCPTCSSTQKYNCYYKNECTSAGGNWCGTESTGWCSEQKCQTCSTTQPWNCYDKSSCEGAKGSWCGNWCTAESCPTCSKSQPWGCYIETDCKANGGNWCGTWCQEGSYPCPSTKGHLGEKEEIFVKPENCKEEKDPVTGYVHFVCEKNFEEKCPVLSDEMKTKCESYGGKFVLKKDKRGCEFADCKFKEEFDPDKKFIFKKFDRCPTDAELNDYQSSCEKSGGTLKTATEGGCKIGFCLSKEEHACEKEINPKFEKEIEEKCKKEGLQVVKDFDPRGCNVLHCGEPDYCKKIPSKAYDECEKQGGELVVKADSKGCATFSECVKPGDEKVYLEENEKIIEVPEDAELLGLALKLEELKVTFDKMAKQSKDIAAYYKSTGSADAKKFERVADMFASTTGKIDEIKTTLKDKLKTLTTADIEEIKLEIRKIRKVVLRDILFVMLSTKEEADEIGEDKELNCGSDNLCFEKSFRVCRKAVFTPQDGNVRITGLEGGKCLVDASFKSPDGIAFSMKCKLPNYALGFEINPEDMLLNCTGNMVDAIKTNKIK